MYFCTLLCFLMFICLTLMTNGSSTKPQHSGLKNNPLNGQHLRVIWPKWEGNPKGLTGPLKGGVMIDYLSARFNFTYEMIRITENQVDPIGNKRGQINYLWERECDLLMTTVIPTSQRLKSIDLTQPWAYDGNAILITASNISANTNAVIKPFQWPVWMSLGISILCIILFLYFSPKLFKLASNEPKTNPYLYVLGNLVSQGGQCKSRQLSFRVVAGVWCLATFVFVQAYTSILITFVLAPTSWPLVESIYDVADSHDINLLVLKAGAIDFLISNSDQTDIHLHQKLKAKVDNYPQSRCNFVSECVNLITPGSRNAFLYAKSFLLDQIKEDFEKTGRCNLQLAKNGFLSVSPSFALPKNSPYTNTISVGLTELLENGLFDYWDLWFRPMPRQCIENFNGKKKSSTKRQRPSRLSLNNLTGGFIVLAVGLCLSLLAFLHEHIVFCWTVKLSTSRRIVV